MAVKLETLRVFRIVAEQGTLARAAEVLGRTPSGVSMILAQLQDEVGAPLFESDRKNRLSPLGLMVLEESGRATDAFDRSVAAIRRHAQSTAGTVRIAAVPSATVTILPKAIAAYRKRRPDVRLEISDVDSGGVLRRLQLDEADIGVLSAGPGDLAAGTEVLQDALGIVCRADGPIAAASRGEGAPGGPGWETLALEPFVANPLGDLVGHPVVAALQEKSTIFARNTTTLLSFVRTGLGATILPSSVVTPEDVSLCFIQPRDPETVRRLLLLENRLRRLTPAAQAFFDILSGTASA